MRIDRVATALFFVTAFAGANASASNIVTDFSSAGNPNGVWSYYYGTGPSSQTPYALSQGFTACVLTGLPCWQNGGSIPDSISIEQNTTGTSHSVETIVLPTGTLLLDPEEYSAAVVFTASAAGTYNITGDFLGIDVDENSHPVTITDDGVAIYSNTISSFGQTDNFNLMESLNPGDAISFNVGTGSTGCTYCFLSTGLAGTVTPVGTTTTGAAVPESGSIEFSLIGVMV
jgi:hypothetical protein